MATMLNPHNVRAAFTLLTGMLVLTACTRSEVIDDFAKLKAFDSDLQQLCANTPGLGCSPHLTASFSGSHVVELTITGRNINRLPKSIYQFQELNKLSLEETAFTSLPNLKLLSNLNQLFIENNRFADSVHLRNLPHSLEYLILSRDAITEVIVDDSLPNLLHLDLTQNRMQSRINSTFCKLPKLSFLDLSSGCCDTEAQAAALEKAAKQVLCNKDVAVRAIGEFVD